MDPLDIRRTRPAQSNIQYPLRESASQTAGPYVHIGCLPSSVGVVGVYPDDLVAFGATAANKTIVITGHVFEGEGITCKDIMLEFWQADANGDYSNGVWRRAGTNLETGEFSIETVMPGSIIDGQGRKLAPFINVWVTARGINIGLLTRIYFPNQGVSNAADPHLALVDENRRDTLLAKQVSNTNGYQFDVHLQGESETVFFDV